MQQESRLKGQVISEVDLQCIVEKSKLYTGEVRKSGDLYPERQNKYDKYVYDACVDCGKERWVILRQNLPESPRCHSCANKRHIHPSGENAYRWKGGKTIHSKGYVYVRLQPDDFFYPMADGKNYVFEHRLVMAKHLGRCLQTWELVHHKNGRKDDNQINNLQLVTDHRHKQITILENRIRHLEGRVALLEAENVLLQKGVNKEC